ncbi:MAG: hypothetical protein Q7S57_03605 [bacterium]|nr:hypothetical protein [bacterium]
MGHANAGTDFTIDQVMAIREMERKLARQGFRGARKEVQDAFEVLHYRIKALKKHRLVDCSKGASIPDGCLILEEDQLPGRKKDEMILSVRFMELWIPEARMPGIYSRAALLEELQQNESAVLPLSVLDHDLLWQHGIFYGLIPDQGSILFWGTIFRDVNGIPTVKGLSRKRADIYLRDFPIDSLRSTVPQREYVALYVNAPMIDTGVW